jgi:hypothetical protein
MGTKMIQIFTDLLASGEVAEVAADEDSDD